MPKKIRLLSTYNGLPPNSIVTVDDGVAASLLAGGIGATTDLTGGVVRYQDTSLSDGGRLTGNQTGIIDVPVGYAVTILGDLGAQGTLEVLNDAGGVLRTQALGSNSAGPFAGPGRFRIKADVGSFSVDTAQNEAMFNLQPRFTYPVMVGTWGDSLTDTSDVATHDLTVATAPLFNSKALYNNRLAHALLFHSGGRIVPVANGGVGGTTSTQILARDTAADGVNRRGAQDVANTGARVCILSIGVNDIVTVVNLATATTQADRDAILAGIYANIATAVRRVQKLGMYPMLREMPGYALENKTYNYANNANKSAADVAMAVSMIKTAAAYISDVLVPTLGEVSLIRYRSRLVDPVTGAWRPGFSTDGLHENRNGVREIAGMIIDEIASMTRPLAGGIAYAPLPTGAGRRNAFVAPAMLPPYTNGRAAGFSASTGTGTHTITGAVTTDPDGKVWQDFTVTPLTFDGVAKAIAPQGLASVVVYLQMSIWGATPAVTVAPGDPFRTEYDLVIDDGAGGPPSVLTWFSEAFIQYPTSQTFRFRSMEQNITDLALMVPDKAIVGKEVSLPIAAPDASANITNALVTLTAYAGTTTPYRIRISSPRIVKVPAPL